MDDIIPTTLNPTLDISGDESRMVDHVRRIQGNRYGCVAVHFHLSQLRPYHREAPHVRIAIRAFDSLINNFEASLYIMANCDLILVCRDVRVAEIDSVVVKLRSLFGEDPLIFHDDGTAAERFASWYDLESDYDAFMALVEDLVAEGQEVTKKGKDADPRAQLGRPMDALTLSAVVDRLRHTRIADLISRQAAVQVVDNGSRVLFLEHFMSIADLKQRVAPGVHIVSDFWLFQYLTEILDRRMLAILGRRDFDGMKQAISINLNIATVSSQDFRTFARRVGTHTDKVVVELQQIDVFADVQRFRDVRDELHDQGFRVLVDAVNPLALQFFDPDLLEADFIKVNWVGELMSHADSGRLDRVRDALWDIRHSVILARIDNEDAVRFGVDLGIHRFQGRFIDQLVAESLSSRGG